MIVCLPAQSDQSCPCCTTFGCVSVGTPPGTHHPRPITKAVSVFPRQKMACHSFRDAYVCTQSCLPLCTQRGGGVHTSVARGVTCPCHEHHHQTTPPVRGPPPISLGKGEGPTPHSRRSACTGYGRLFCTNHQDAATYGHGPKVFTHVCFFTGCSHTRVVVCNTRLPHTHHTTPLSHPSNQACVRVHPVEKNPQEGTTARGTVLSGMRPSSGKCFHARHSPVALSCWRSGTPFFCSTRICIWIYGCGTHVGWGVIDG